jgi:hypothetical protein
VVDVLSKSIVAHAVDRNKDMHTTKINHVKTHVNFKFTHIRLFAKKGDHMLIN